MLLSGAANRPARFAGGHFTEQLHVLEGAGNAGQRNIRRGAADQGGTPQSAPAVGW
jgi:hypothetical protein